MFSWISNANKGTNETTCVRTHLVKLGNHATVLNFFFRENFNLARLQRKGNRAKRTNLSRLTTVGKIAFAKTTLKHCWTTRKFFRKSARKQQTVVRKSLKRVLRIANYRLPKYAAATVRRPKLTRLARQRRRVFKQLKWKARSLQGVGRPTRSLLVAPATKT